MVACVAVREAEGTDPHCTGKLVAASLRDAGSDVKDASNRCDAPRLASRDPRHHVADDPVAALAVENVEAAGFLAQRRRQGFP